MTDDFDTGADTARPSRHARRGIGSAASMGLVLFAILVLTGVVGAGASLAVFLGLSRDLPDPSLLEQIQLPQQSVVMDRTGTVELARFGDYNRQVVTFDEIPALLIDATTAVEDRTFWDNAGFDTIGILSAGLDALRGNARGGSTITQQLVRQRLLTTTGEAETQVTLSRKLREIIQSIRVTEAYAGVEGKQRIITAYLNQNYYGNDAYGVAAAAQAYFGKDLRDLTLAQAAILAAIPKSPSTYDLVQNAVEQCIDPSQPEDTCETQLVVPDDTPIVQRRNQVLDLMQEGRTPLTGHELTAADFDAARSEPVVLAPQRSTQWKVPQFVYQVRRELTDRLCGADADTCPDLERGGLTITTTLDMKLQAIAERWVKAATIVPNSKNPRATARALGLDYQPWMANLRSKNLHNGALVALDYQTGELVAYVGSADPTATKATRKFQPRFDVLADGWRQPGSAFKPVVYSTGIGDKRLTASTMLMDVTTDFGGGYVPTDADPVERGPVRVRNALQFSLNIPAVKATAIIGNDNIQRQAEAMGVQFQNGTVKAGLSFALGVEVVHPLDLVRAYGVLGDGGKLADRTTIRTVVDAAGAPVLSEDQRPKPRQVLDPGAAAIVTDILAGNTNPSINPYWGAFRITDHGRRRPATLKTGTNNDARDLNAYGYIGAPGTADRANGEYALAVGVWNGNSDNSLVSTPSDPLFSIDVSTYVWQGFLREATAGWKIHGFPKPDGIHTAAVDPWTGLAASAGGPSVDELFLNGTDPGPALAPGTCGDAVLGVAGYEAQHPDWIAADQGWLKRARRGAGVAGGPKHTTTAYFYGGYLAFYPYGRSWGPLVGGEGCGSPSPSPTPSFDPCASYDPFASVDPSASPVSCPSPSASPTEPPSEVPTPTPGATPTPAPTATPPPATPTPTPPPTATPAPTPTPSPVSTPTPPPA
jgi:membrane peptidoglycan carboxypeptidase